MKLEKWALIAEIVSGLAVVVTLAILIAGIRENTNATRASVYTTSIEGLNALNRTVLADPDLSRIFSALNTGQGADLDGLDAVRLNHMIVTTFRTYDTAHSMRNYGLFGDNEWDRMERAICLNFGNVVAAGRAEVVYRLTSDEFSEFLRSTCSN